MRRLLGATALAWLALAGPAVADDAALRIGYINLDHDPRHAELRSYANIVLREAYDPYQGAETALQESRVLARAAGLTFSLSRVSGADAGALGAAAEKLAADGVRLALIDAPAAAIVPTARRAAAVGLTLFNVSARGDALRGADCAANLMHTVPSLTMLSDALAQHAAAHHWRDVLVLRGNRPEDARKVERFTRSAHRFGLNIEAVRQFVDNNDPRQREQNDVGLLTSDADYDLIFVADATQDTGRYIPYMSKRARPVIGDFGLVASAWHWSWERYGAPQLNRRFERLAHRHMTDDDWAAWAATSLILRAAAAARSTDASVILKRLKAPDLTFDAYKGSPASFRSWDNQLRQPILLHTSDAVVAKAPEEGFLHPTETLDTLGVDRPETQCHAATASAEQIEGNRGATTPKR